jgi:N-acetylneuraminic acid mutarotase
VKFNSTLLLGAALSQLFIAVHSVHAQGTFFTYQGQLADNGSPANGSYDLRFSLFDSSSSGTQFGGTPIRPATLVSNGLFTVEINFGANFPGADRWLQLEVRTNGGGAFTALAPRQQLTATPYAITAGNVTGPINGSSIVGGTITGAQLANGAVGAVNIANNSITSSQMASGAAAANLNAGGQSGVASGGIILSSNANSAQLLSAGYVKIGAITVADAWQPRDLGPPLVARSSHTAVWTGSEMIIWGGANDAAVFNDGGRYNPAADNWTAVTTSGAPGPRFEHTAVWTGTEMIVWGGLDNTNILNDGGRYNPAGNSWSLILTNLPNTPSPRQLFTAVWTGTQMIIWGGYGGDVLNDGFRYSPAGNSWTTMTTNAAAGARYQHNAVWTGTEMIIWGGRHPISMPAGARYNPVGNSWTTMSTNGAPAPRLVNTAIWTGNEMIIWGGSSTTYTNDGGRYNPASDSWTPVTTVGAPAGRYFHTAVWTGSEMIVWGGANGVTSFNDGGRYNNSAKTWTAMSTVGAPPGRAGHTAIWTGSEMIVWGGNYVIYFNDNFSCSPGRVLSLYQRP